ncbi:uncharacterized protein VTP21DRAFT_753 [Calcarisporiella thermophila]|uniref:uncharacterized protein n=1 Tax=Calcarisporiella thermophila TaxID=911321 RepID=UPI0037434C6B
MLLSKEKLPSARWPRNERQPALGPFLMCAERVALQAQSCSRQASISLVRNTGDPRWTPIFHLHITHGLSSCPYPAWSPLSISRGPVLRLLNSVMRNALQRRDIAKDQPRLAETERGPEIANDGNVEYPDGRYGWCIVFACFLLNFVVFGFNNVWGIFQAHYLENLPSASLFLLSLCGSISAGLLFAAGPISLPLVTRFGYRLPLSIGTILAPAGIVLMSFATHVWHLYLSFSIMFALGASMLFVASTPLIPQWFLRKRGLATSLCATGGGVGSLILSPVSQHLIDRVGVQWCLRIVGCCCLLLCTMATLLVKPYTLRDRGSREIASDWSFLQLPGFWGILSFSFLHLLGFIAPYYFVPSHAISAGVSPQMSSIFVALMAGFSIPGRLCCGFLSDLYGPFNISLLSIFLSGVFCFCIWALPPSFASLCTFSLLYGFFGAVSSTLVPALTPKVVKMERLDSALNFLFFTNSLPMIIGGLVIGVLVHVLHGYLAAALFTGTVFLLGAGCLLCTKLWINKSWLAKV